MPIIPIEQTAEQRQRALTDAGMAPTPAAPAAPTLSPIQRSIDPAVDGAQSFLDRPFQAPETREQITERKRKEAQGLIDGIEQEYTVKKAEREKVGQERVAMDNAVSVLSGLMGSTEATRTRGAVNEANSKEMQALAAQKSQDLARVYMNISKEAQEESRQQLEDATRTAESVVARRKEVQTRAQESIKQMAMGGLVDFDSFKNAPQNADVYRHALDAYGGSEDALRAAFVLNRPKDQILGTPQRIGNKYVQAYQKPNGQVKYETIDMPVDLPIEYKTFQKMGDNLVAIPDNWDGDTSKLKTIAGTPSTMERLQQQQLALNIQGQRLSNAKAAQDLAANAPGAVSSKAAEQKAEALALARELRGEDALGKQSAIGASAAKLVPWGRSLGLQGNRAAFEAKVDTLKANLTLDNLKLLKGSMSDKDMAFLQAVGSSLNADMSEEAFDAEMDKIILKLGGTSGTPSGNQDLQQGEILVKDKASGQIGAIPAHEFDPALYERQ